MLTLAKFCERKSSGKSQHWCTIQNLELRNKGIFKNVMHFIYYITFTLLKLHPIVHLKKYKWTKLTDIDNLVESQKDLGISTFKKINDLSLKVHNLWLNYSWKESYHLGKSFSTWKGDCRWPQKTKGKLWKISYSHPKVVFLKISVNSLHQNESTRNKPQNQTVSTWNKPIHQTCLPGTNIST